MENLKLLSEIALAFQRLDDFETEMKKVLDDIGKSMDVSRICIFLNETKEIGENAFQWCNKDLAKDDFNFKKILYKNMPSFQRILEKDGQIISNDIMDLPQDLIDVFNPKGVKSLIIYPLIVRKETIGFIGVNEFRYKRTWEEEELHMLSTVSRLISSVYERKFDQEEIINSEANFRSIFHSNPMPMFISSIDERRFVKANPTFIEKTGYLEEDLIGKTVTELDFFVDNEKIKEIGKRLSKLETIKDEELVIRCKDGSLLRGLFSIEVINNKGEKSFLTVIVDITDKVKLMKNVEDKWQKLTHIIEGTNLATWQWDIQTGEVDFNDQWAKMIGYTLEELQPTTIETWNKFSHPEDLKLSNKIMEKHLKGQLDYYDCELRMKHKDGRWIWIHDKGKVTKHDSKGFPTIIFGTHSDITVKKQQELELERFFSINLDLLCIADLEGNFIKINKAWEDIFGYSENELMQGKFHDFVHPDDIASTIGAMETLKKGEKVTHFINRHIDKRGKYHYIEWKSNSYEDLIYAAARDITERIKYEEEILKLSNKDCLTNAYNRRYIYKRAKETIEEYKRSDKSFSVCIIDIDNFKKINDKFGHGIGDCVLKEFTKIIKKNLRPYDILGRYGGEEFIIVLKDIDEKCSNLVIERILNIIRDKTFIFDGKNINFTFSAGIVSCKEVKKSEVVIEKLVNIADKRMYEAKRSGKNKIISSVL